MTGWRSFAAVAALLPGWAAGCTVVVGDVQPPRCEHTSECAATNQALGLMDDCRPYQCVQHRCQRAARDQDDDGEVDLRCDGTDCDDGNANVRGTAPNAERCDGLDNDCNGVVDDGVEPPPGGVFIAPVPALVAAAHAPLPAGRAALLYQHAGGTSFDELGSAAPVTPPAPTPLPTRSVPAPQLVVDTDAASAVLPSAARAQVCAPPAASCVGAEPAGRPSTTVGSARSLIEPSPSCPALFAPQHTAAPARAAHVWRAPALSALAPASPATATGAARSLIEPSPSWPRSFAPQQRTLPSLSRAQVCSSPATSCVALAIPATATGAARALIEPSPSWPWSFAPQHHTVPSLSPAQL